MSKLKRSKIIYKKSKILVKLLIKKIKIKKRKNLFLKLKRLQDFKVQSI